MEGRKANGEQKSKWREEKANEERKSKWGVKKQVGAQTQWSDKRDAVIQGKGSKEKKKQCQLCHKMLLAEKDPLALSDFHSVGEQLQSIGVPSEEQKKDGNALRPKAALTRTVTKFK